MTDVVGRALVAGSRCSLTRSVLAEWAAGGTPRQREYLLGYLEAEAASRDASKRRQLLRRCAAPYARTLEGYDWTPASFPEGFGRADLESLSFVDAHEDLVLMGSSGTGNYAGKRIMLRNGLSLQVERSRQPCSFA